MHGTTQHVSVKPSFFTTYLQYHSDRNCKEYISHYFEMPTETKTHGLMSYKANKRVRLAIDWMVYLSKEKKSPVTKQAGEFNFQLNFITLTLSSKQIHSDNEIKKTLLNQFLTEIRQSYNCRHYMWRAESQRNGNIHFHVVTDVFVPWRKLRTQWNRIQEKLGYISRFTERTGKVDPNSTDIHAIKAVKNLPAYLAKYCSKNSKGYTVLVSKAQAEPFKPESWLTYKHPRLVPKAHYYRQIHGKLWGLSQILSKLQSGKKELTNLIKAEVEWLEKKFPKKVKFCKNATLFLFDQADLLKKKCFGLIGLLKQHVQDVLHPKPPPEPLPIQNTILTILPKKHDFYQVSLF